MRLLFIGLNANYINPTNQLIHRMLMLFADTLCFGPGYVSEDELEAGVESFAEKHGPFDFVITTSQLALTSNVDIFIKFYKRYAVRRWRNDESLRMFLNDIQSFLSTQPFKKIVFAMDLDTHGVSADLLCRLDHFADYICAWGKGFSRPCSELPNLMLEPAYAKKAQQVSLGLWYDFCNSNFRRFINVGHFVGFDEFCFSPISLRKLAVSVPGVLYRSRRQTLDKLREHSDLRIGSTRYQVLYSILDKLGISPYSNPVLHLIYRGLFVNLLSSSKIVMTDGAAYDMMIRKFVEIPACGSLLLSRPCAGFDKLGFRDGESAVILNENDVISQVRRLLSDHERMQMIASKGQEIVWRNHSIQARASQVSRSLVKIMNGSYAGSIWSDGEFQLLEGPNAEVPECGLMADSALDSPQCIQ